MLEKQPKDENQYLHIKWKQQPNKLGGIRVIHNCQNAIDNFIRD